MRNYKEIAKVTNNNQPGWLNIIETEPNVTLDIGTRLYVKTTDDLDYQQMHDIRMFCVRTAQDLVGSNLSEQNVINSAKEIEKYITG